MSDDALAARLAAAKFDWIVPGWPAPPSVHALSTTRHQGPGREIDFSPRNPAVAQARSELRRFVPRDPAWLAQVHGAAIVSGDVVPGTAPRADGAVARSAGNVCAILTGDCLPVLFTSVDGSIVAAAHAGWRGLAAGVLEATVDAMRVDPSAVLAWLGPAIGPGAFEVGADVYTIFNGHDPATDACFRPVRAGKWHADLYGLARHRLARAGVHEVHGGGWCTFTERDRFYSYRRGGADATRRMATVIWRAEP
jgi:YfiH family protein